MGATATAVSATSAFRADANLEYADESELWCNCVSYEGPGYLHRRLTAGDAIAGVGKLTKGSVLGFELAEGLLKVSLDGEAVEEAVEGLEDMELRPFVGFYRSNVGNEAWIRRPS